MQAISEDPRDKSNRSAAKEKFTRFFDLLDEVIERHKLVAVLEDDVAGRDAMRDEVVMVVIPSFQKFTRKQKDKEFSKSMLLLFRPTFSFTSKPYFIFRSPLDPQKCERDLHLCDSQLDLPFNRY